MCGRFVLFSSLNRIKDEFDIEEIHWEYNPRYNIAPEQDVAGVVKHEVNHLAKFRWGLIPFWADSPDTGYRMINARSESITDKKSFSRPLKDKRCLIVADGFYEWYKKGNNKTPVYFHLKSGNPFGFAGIYEVWHGEDGSKISSCSIITTEANEAVKQYHHRMPVIIKKKDRETWLDREISDFDILTPLLKPYPAEEIESYEVTEKVNSYRFDNPQCIKPV